VNFLKPFGVRINKWNDENKLKFQSSNLSLLRVAKWMTDHSGYYEGFALLKLSI
jgi:hypothetical protein